MCPAQACCLIGHHVGSRARVGVGTVGYILTRALARRISKLKGIIIFPHINFYGIGNSTKFHLMELSSFITQPALGKPYTRSVLVLKPCPLALTVKGVITVSSTSCVRVPSPIQLLWTCSVLCCKRRESCCAAVSTSWPCFFYMYHDVS